MTQGGQAQAIAAAIRSALDRLQALGGEVLAPFAAATRSAAEFGPPAAAQHLRNRLLAHGSARALARQPPSGLSAAQLPIILAAIDELEQALEAVLAEPASPAPPAPRADRVLFVLDHLPAGGRIFSHTRQVCAYAAALARAPEIARIGVLATQETAPENPVGASEVEGPDNPGWRAELEAIDPLAGAKVSFHTPARRGQVRPHGAAVAWARRFEAAVIVAPQGIFRSRVVAPVLARRAAAIGLQMNATNPEPPFADLILAHGDGGGGAVRPTPARWRDHKVPMLPFSPLVDAAAPADVAAALVVATVLTEGRLERGLLKDRAADLTLVVDFLAAHEGATWRMVGLDDPTAFAKRLATASSAAAALIGTGQLALMGVVPDPAAQFAAGGLYVHLPALGGGAMGAAMAIKAGMAVLGRAGSDIANLLPAGHVFRDARQARLWLWRLAAEPALRSRWNMAQRRALDRDHSIDGAAVALRPILAEARAIAASKLDMEGP